MSELKINDEILLQYGPYRTTGTAVRITPTPELVERRRLQAVAARQRARDLLAKVESW